MTHELRIIVEKVSVSSQEVMQRDTMVAEGVTRIVVKQIG